MRAYHTIVCVEDSERKDGAFALTGNMLKLAACAFMLVDHTGMILFPDVIALRVIGRLAMPLFAFTFAEGCFYTRHKLRHLLTVLIIGVCTSAVASVARGQVCGDILITFSLSAAVIYALDALKRAVVLRDGRASALYAVLLVLAVGGSVFLCCFSGARIDYGIAGVMLPVTVRLLDMRSFGATSELAESIYNRATMLLCFGAGLLAVSVASGGVQIFCVLALIPLMFYGGRRGKAKLKYFFYIFYPAHLALLCGIYLIVHPDFLSALL